MHRRNVLTLLGGLGGLALGYSAQAARPANASAPPLMLAQVWPGHVDPTRDLGDYWVSEKYDGVRGYWDGQRLLTRSGEPIAAPAWFTAHWPATPLDGELWAGRGRFAQAVSTIRQQTPDDAAWRALRYMVFDLPAHPGPFTERRLALQQAITPLAQPWVQAVAHEPAPDAAGLQTRLNDTVAAGGEGLMLNRGSAPYRTNRSDDLLKFKPYDDADALVFAHLPGQGKHAGRLGALLVQTTDGQRLKLGTGFSDAEREHPPAVGSRISFRYRGLTSQGLPRFASFLRVRSDLD
jgi:DNA ligase-1